MGFKFQKCQSGFCAENILSETRVRARRPGRSYHNNSVRDDDGSEEGGNSRSREKWSDGGYVLMIINRIS